MVSVVNRFAFLLFVGSLYAGAVEADETAARGQDAIANEYARHVVADRKRALMEGMELLAEERRLQASMASLNGTVDDASVRIATALETNLALFVDAPVSHRLFKFWRKPPTPGIIGRVEIVQIVGPETMHITIGKTRYCIKGVATHKFAVNRDLPLDGVYYVDGEDTYTTVQGFKNTILSLRQIDSKAVERALADANRAKEWKAGWLEMQESHELVKQKMQQDVAIHERRKKQEKKREELKHYREWVSAGGKYSVKAKYVRYEKGDVILLRLDGTTVNVQLQKLSKDDRNYVKERRREERKLRLRSEPQQSDSDRPTVQVSIASLENDLKTLERGPRIAQVLRELSSAVEGLRNRDEHADSMKRDE